MAIPGNQHCANCIGTFSFHKVSVTPQIAENPGHDYSAKRLRVELVSVCLSVCPSVYYTPTLGEQLE